MSWANANREYLHQYVVAIWIQGNVVNSVWISDTLLSPFLNFACQAILQLRFTRRGIFPPVVVRSIVNKQAYLKGEIHIKNVQESRRNQRLLCRYIFNIINVIVVTDTYLVLYQVAWVMAYTTHWIQNLKINTIIPKWKTWDTCWWMHFQSFTSTLFSRLVSWRWVVSCSSLKKSISRILIIYDMKRSFGKNYPDYFSPLEKCSTFPIVLFMP